MRWRWVGGPEECVGVAGGRCGGGGGGWGQGARELAGKRHLRAGATGWWRSGRRGGDEGGEETALAGFLAPSP